MGKILSLILAISMCFFASVYTPANLDFFVSKVTGQYAILDDGKDYQTIKVFGDNYDKVLEKLSLEKVSTKNVSDRVIIEGYSPRLKNYKVIDGRKINVQVSIDGDYFIIGYPLIYGSF